MFEKYKDLLNFLSNLPTPETPEDIAACTYSDIIDDISMALVDYRMQHNMSQIDLSKQLSISQTMVSQYESGARNISLNTLCSLMAKLGKKVILSFEEASDLSSHTQIIDPVVEIEAELTKEYALSA